MSKDWVKAAAPGRSRGDRGSFWREDVPLLWPELDCQSDPASSALCASKGAGKKQTRALFLGEARNHGIPECFV